MYYPILRGRLNEFLALRELSKLALYDSFCPVIEPVREDLSGLTKTVKELNSANIIPVIIINPLKGDFKDQYSLIIDDLISNGLTFLPCFTVHDKVAEIPQQIKNLDKYALFILGGVTPAIVEESLNAQIIFVNHDISPSILRKMKNVVLCGDFFKRQQKNSAYPEESSFSSLHTYYKDFKTVIGFGDYTIVGEDILEAGGPAYVVAIHLSYIDPERYDEMFIRHYRSYDNKSPTQPGNKFKDALSKLMVDIDEQKIPFVPTSAILEFKALHQVEHFPGLGQVKKISIKHHIETLVNYIKNN